MNVVIFSDVNGVPGFGRYAGAYRVATELRAAGFSTQVVEFFADWSLAEIETIVGRFVGPETLFVGFATTLMIRKTLRDISRLDRTRENRYSGHLPQDEGFVADVFRMIKARNPATKLVIGGGKSRMTELPGVDYWVWGPADTSAVALARHLSEGGPLVTHPGRTGEVVSAVNYPYRDFATSRIAWQPHDHVFEGEHLPIEIARGCVFRCDFCANQLQKQRREFERPAESVRDELLVNYDRFGTTGYMFCDDTYNDSLEKVQSLKRIFDELPFRIEWVGFARPDVIHRHPEQREILLESGLRSVLFGIETFHPEAAKNVGRGLHPDKIKQTLYHLRDTWAGRVIMTGSFIVGLPGESVDSLERTMDWVLRDDCPLDHAIFSPLNIRPATDDPDSPTSKIADDPARYGYTVTGPPPGSGISTDGPFWTNEHMNKREAERLTRVFQDRLAPRQPTGDWSSYSRLRSLGHGHEELARPRTDNGLEQDAWARREQMRAEYLEKLLT